jgi:hypothetical protein
VAEIDASHAQKLRHRSGQEPVAQSTPVPTAPISQSGHKGGKAMSEKPKRNTNKPHIIPAPDWLKKRMTVVRSQSHVTLSDMIQQGKASERIRRESYRADTKETK